MARERIDEYWRERIRYLTEKGNGSTSITAQLKAEAKRSGREKPPSEKTVRTYKSVFRNAPEQERRQYRLVYWPESFGTPELPWESAPAVLEAMRNYDYEEEGRPTVRTAKWIWRLTLAQPEMLASMRQQEQDPTPLQLAAACAACEASGLPKADETWRAMERVLLHPEDKSLFEQFNVWTTPEAAEAEGIFNAAEAEEFREEKRQREAQKEGETES